MKRAHSGIDCRAARGDLADEVSATLVSIGGVRATGTLVAREGQASQPAYQPTNAEYASDGYMRSTMYITNNMGAQNYLGYPQGPESQVINLGEPTQTNFMAGQMSVDGQSAL